MKPKKQALYQIPMPGAPKKDFVTQIDWNHFWGWIGAPRKESNQNELAATP